jgi:hypothetical protein
MKRVTSILIAVVVVVVVAFFGYFFWNNNRSLKTSTEGMSEYSAVALTSNELFFGKISSENDKQIVLDSVYFFTFVSDNGTAATGSGQNNQNLKPTLIDTAAKDSIAPTNTYVINKAMVKYTYPLKNDSQVVKTIADYKNK